MSKQKEKESTFWDHLEALRWVFLRIIVVVVVFMLIAFLNKDLIFSIILAPHKSDFILYRFFCYVSKEISIPAICPDAFQVTLINTQLASQFLIHMKIAFYVGVLVAFPYIIYQLFRFVSPALYHEEKKYTFMVILYSFLLFLFGVLLNYFLIFPLSFRFLGTYQVSEDIQNTINLSSYINTFLMLSLMLGIMSELPIISWLFAKLGFLTDTFMKRYRKQAIVIILIIAAIITPTADAFTLLLVFFPIYLLYEVSIFIVKSSLKKKRNAIKAEEKEWKNPYKTE
jgi:sec-independent protein translocase protein TatC